MQNFNIHTHTTRCNHAVGTDEEYVLAAIEGKFKLLGFSDHSPLIENTVAEWQMLDSQVDEYIQSINNLKVKYKDEIEILVGFESEYLYDRIDYLKSLRSKVDYMICGQHLKKYHDEYGWNCSDDDCAMYAEHIEKACESGLYTYIAHPDYFLLGRDTYSKACELAAERICDASLKYDIPLELNIGSYKYGEKLLTNEMTGETFNSYAFPNIWFWKTIEAKQCKVVFGYDAHNPNVLKTHDKEQEYLDLLGLNLNLQNKIDIK